MNAADLTAVAQLFLTPALAATAFYLRTLAIRLESMENELAQINARLIRLEEWRNLAERGDRHR